MAGGHRPGRAHEVLGLTFTTKATHELASRIRDSLRAAGILHAPGRRPLRDLEPPGTEADDGPEPPEEPTVSTYNAYAAGLLTEHGLRIGHEPETRVIADASRYQLAARVIARYTGRVELLSDHPKTVIDYLLALDAAMTEHLVGPDDVRRFHEEHRGRFAEALAAETYKTKAEEVAKVLHAFDRREELLGLVESYRRHKRHLGLMDFSDQIELGARLATERPEVGALERAKYKVVLLDEYQDTSVAQALMLGRLFSGETPDTGLGHAVSAVGDPNQAIYGWRGASVSNILRFGEDFRTAEGSSDVRTYPLVVNRRSGPPDPPGRQRPRCAALRRHRGRAPARGQARCRPRRGPGGGPRGLPRRAGLAPGPGQGRPQGDGEAGVEGDRRPDPRQQARGRRLRRADLGGDPGGDRRAPGPAAAARGGRGRGDPDAAARPHRQRRAADPAHRSPLGDRRP